MSTLIVAVLSFVGFIVAYHTYGRWLSKRIFNLDEKADVGSVRDQVMDVVKAAFRPEFLNRLDEIILFERLKREHMTAIVDIQAARLQGLLDDRKIVLDINDTARTWLATHFARGRRWSTGSLGGAKARCERHKPPDPAPGLVPLVSRPWLSERR